MAESKELLPAPTTLAEAWKLCECLSQSALLPDIFKKKPENILPAMMLSKSLGIPIFQGLQSIAVVNGKPTIYGDCALAIVRASGQLEDFEEVVTGTGENLKAVCICRRKGYKTPIIGEFTFQDAKTAGLANKDVWKKYPKRMLKMRARAYALRDGFADLLSGISVAEEMQDVEDNQPNTGGSTPMPKAKKAAQKPQPAEVVEPNNDVIEAIQEAAPEASTAQAPAEDVEDIEANPVETLEEDDVGEAEDAPASDPYGVQTEIQPYLDLIAQATSYKDLIAIYKDTPAEYQSEIKLACAERKKELEQE